MALHGEIKINGLEIVYWEAVRQESLGSVGQTSVYKCKVFDQEGQHKFVVSHVYSDGAAVLLSIIMRRYNYLKNGVSLDGQEPA